MSATTEVKQRNYNNRGIRPDHHCFLEPIVDWLFEHGAHRVQVIPSLTDFPEGIEKTYHIDTFSLHKKHFLTLTDLDVDALNQNNRAYSIIKSGYFRSTRGDGYCSDIQVLKPLETKLYLAVYLLPYVQDNLVETDINTFQIWSNS